MLESLLRHKKEEKEFLLALVISENRIDAALWETSKEGHAQVLKTADAPYEGEWEKAIDAADQAISSVEDALPQNTELKKVVFGLFPEWLENDHIKVSHLKHLKQLTSALSLTPVGFVELPTAVSHLLARDEGSQQTVIVIGLEKRHLTVSLFKIGKLVGSHTLVRSPNPSQDVEKGLAMFNAEVLPSRMLIYGTTQDFEEVKNDMLSYPWAEKMGFLHFPKIEALSTNFAVKAVAFASAIEMMPHTESEAETQENIGAPPVDTEVTESHIAPAIDRSDEVADAAEDLGFVADRDVGEEIAVPSVHEPQMAIDDTEPHENVVPVEVPRAKGAVGRLPSLPRLPRFSLPNMSFSVKIPKLPKVGLIVAILIVLFIIGAGGTLAYWVLPKAEVQILVQPQIFDKTEEISIDTKTTVVDIEKRILPGSTVKTEVNGTASTGASGKKTVGDPATGEITIFNKTLNTKTFKKGTNVTAGKLVFTLDADVNVASASEGVGSLTYGTTKAKISARAIGTASNLPSGTDFVFDGLPNTSYTARNESALSGGTSREVLVISRDDQKAVRDQAVQELEKKVEGELAGKLAAGEKLLDNSLKTKIVSEKYSKEIGEEGNDISVDVTLSIEAASYSENDLYSLIDSVVGSQIPSGYEYARENSTITVGETIADEGVWTFKPHIAIKLIPKVETQDYAKNLAGKKLADATEYLKSQTAVAGVEYAISSPLSFLKNALPANPANIHITIKAL